MELDRSVDDGEPLGFFRRGGRFRVFGPYLVGIRAAERQQQEYRRRK
jgi:hypothetical protein